MKNSTVSELVRGETKQVTWHFKNWSADHDLLVASTQGCFLQIGDPKVIIRFFLHPFHQTCKTAQDELAKGRRVTNCYSLFAEMMQSPPNFSIKVTASQTGIYSTGVITPTKSGSKVVAVAQDFIHVVEWLHLVYSSSRAPIPELTYITINVTLCDINESSTGDSVVELQQIPTGESDEEEASLFGQLKAMYAAENNYSDLKLESKDGMVLPAHKFHLAARSPYFRKLIDNQVKKGSIDGTLQINHVNGKPLMMILYWIYTGELNEKVGRFMEEIVDAAIKFELMGLMKILDKKLIAICNKDNMFKLHKVAQKNGMPTAVEDIAAYIRRNI